MTGMICVCLVRRIVMLGAMLAALRTDGRCVIHLLDGVGFRLFRMVVSVFEIGGFGLLYIMF